MVKAILGTSSNNVSIKVKDELILILQYENVIIIKSFNTTAVSHEI